MALRADTKRGLACLLLGFGLLLLRGWLAGTPDLVGELLEAAAPAAALWGVLAIRSLNDGGRLHLAVDDGLAAVCVAVWAVAVRSPPSAETSSADTFALVSVPVSLSGVLFLLGARALWSQRTVGGWFLRFGSALALSAATACALHSIAAGSTSMTTVTP